MQANRRSTDGAAMCDEMVAFSDEKGHGEERYWGISVVSGPIRSLWNVRGQLRQVLHDSGDLDCLEWKDVNGDSRRQRAAKGYVQAAVSAACSGTLRIDTLIWDMQDTRHTIPGRDDMGNLARMYYHVLAHCGRMWTKPRWRIYPDSNSALDWHNIASYVSRAKVIKPKPYLLRLFAEDEECFEIIEVRMQDSVREPLVQLADIFVGMGCLCAQKGHGVRQWMQEELRRNQPTLFPASSNHHHGSSRTEKARFDLIGGFYSRCRANRLGVSLQTEGRLRTWEPRNPINFWFYEPQHQLDRAPKKQ